VTGFDPWPDGDDFEYEPRKYSYAVRVSDRDGYSSEGFRWPARGHVTAAAWSPDGREGLYGFLHGEGNIALPVLLHNYWHCWQVVVVRDDEIRPGIGWKEVRFPQGWVRYSGELADVLAALRAEGTPYATRVADNVSLSVQWIGHVLDGNTGPLRGCYNQSEKDALLDAYRALPYLGETDAERHRTFKYCLENIDIFYRPRMSDELPHLYKGPDPDFYLPHPGQIPPPPSEQP
jgi:hypothetical protein